MDCLTRISSGCKLPQQYEQCKVFGKNLSLPLVEFCFFLNNLTNFSFLSPTQKAFIFRALVAKLTELSLSDDVLLRTLNFMKKKKLKISGNFQIIQTI